MESQYIQQLAETFEGHAIADHFVDVNKMVEFGSAEGVV